MNPNPSPSTRFLPGNRANPNGRPKGRTLTEELRAVLIRTCFAASASSRHDRRRRAAESMLYHAIQGNPMFAREILDRLEGKVKDAPAPLASMADARLR